MSVFSFWVRFFWVDGLLIWVWIWVFFLFGLCCVVLCVWYVISDMCRVVWYGVVWCGGGKDII